jgi:hypothetical protein
MVAIVSVGESGTPGDSPVGSTDWMTTCAESGAAVDSVAGLPVYFAGSDESLPAVDEGGALGALVTATLEMVSATAAVGVSAAVIAASAEAMPAGESMAGSVLAVVSSSEGAQAVDLTARGSAIDDHVEEHVLFVDVSLATAATAVGETAPSVDASQAQVPFDPTLHAYNTATVTFDRRRARVEYTSPHARPD